MRFLPRLAETRVSEFCIEVRPQEKAKESLENLRVMAADRRPCFAAKRRKSYK